MNYFIKKLLFLLPPETAHNFTLKSLQTAYHLGILRPKTPIKSTPHTVMGLTFPNRLGLAAGLDKNADYIESLATLGFGFIEIGTVTPKPQLGNPKPRLFRLVEHEALINRLGFNNKGLDYVVEKLKHTSYKGILGVNIGKNRDTTIDNAVEDYLIGFRRVAPYASYVTINISSPNTAALRDLQHGDLLRVLLKKLKDEQARQPHYVPLVVKIAPDLVQSELENIADILLSEKIDGVIATNTTIQREDISSSPYANELGGLSGKPLFAKSTQLLQSLHLLLQNKIPIIGCGGISSAEDARQKIEHGAELVQLYTGLVYRGPNLVTDIVKHLL